MEVFFLGNVMRNKVKLTVVVPSADDRRFPTHLEVKVKKLCYNRRSVCQSVLVSGTHLGPATNFSPSFFNYF
jgi:hypothetical protein